MAIKMENVKPRRVIDYIADMLEESGHTQVFALPGGSTPFIVEEFFKRDKFNTIIARHEASAAIMADVYGRLTRKPAILIGQGIFMATNGGFGISEAFYAGVPMVIITEFSDWYGFNMHGCYQLGNGQYGAVDLPALYKSMCKQVFTASEPEELYYAVQLAIKHATSGRPGPVAVISRWNAMMGLINDPSQLKSLPQPFQPLSGYVNVKPPCISGKDAIEIAKMLVSAERPVMICGRGVHASGAYNEIVELAELIGMPVATSYMGKSTIPETHELAVGSTGAIGQKIANQLVKNADFILAVGTCLAPDNTKNCSFDFINPKKQNIVQIDIEPRNAGWTYPITLGVTSDAKLALQHILDSVKTINPSIDLEKRRNELKTLKENPEMEFFDSKFFYKEEVPLDPERIVKSVNNLIRENDLIVLDAGNNRMAFTKLFRTKKAGQLIAPGGVAGMGWCASAALAAQMVHKEGKVIGITGDGGMMMALYCLETAKQFNLAIIYVLLNNSSLGNVRDFLTTKGRKVMEYEEADFSAIARGFGVDSVKVNDFVQFEDAFKRALESDKPTLIDVTVKRASHLRLQTV